MKSLLLRPTFVFMVMILAEMGEGPLSDLMFFQERQGFDVIAMGFDRFRTQSKIFTCQSLCMLKDRTS
jgi:hypothetical protein